MTDTPKPIPFPARPGIARAPVSPPPMQPRPDPSPLPQGDPGDETAPPRPSLRSMPLVGAIDPVGLVRLAGLQAELSRALAIETAAQCVQAMAEETLRGSIDTYSRAEVVAMLCAAARHVRRCRDIGAVTMPEAKA